MDGTIRELKGGVSIAGGCTNGVKAAQHLHGGHAAQGDYGRLYMQQSVQAGLRHLDEVRWVKAYRTYGASWQHDVKVDFSGNAAADEAAKKAKDRHPPIPRQALDAARAGRRLARRLLALAHEVWQQWPELPVCERECQPGAGLP